MTKEDYLKEIALYLEGLKAGKGDLHPLGEMHLRELWKAINYFQKSTKK